MAHLDTKEAARRPSFFFFTKPVTKSFFFKATL